MKLKNLLTEAETFTATNKKTGKTSVFKSKDSRDSAVKGGTHTNVKEPKAGGKAKSGVNIFDKPVKGGTKEEPKKDEPKAEPAKKRPGNPQVNKEAKKNAEELGVTPQKLGNEKYKKVMFQAAIEALTDSNFHSEARELVASIEGKPEWAKKVDYPSMDDPQYDEKMKAIRTTGVDSSEYWGGDDNAHELGRKVSQASGWGGVEAADGIAFTLRMNGFHKESDKSQSIFDNKPYMKNESMSLVKMIKK